MSRYRKSFAVMGRRAAVMLCLVLTAVFLLPAGVHAGEKVVRVGWFDSPWNRMDQFGRRTGYSYEYQSKIASYTGWTYEYVEASWPDLLEMLKNGEIDLLSDVSYTEERTKDMLFPSYSMGTEEYYLYIAANNTDYIQGVYSYFNGKKIGVNKGSVQAEFFKNWATAHRVHPELIEVTGKDQESIEMVLKGELDGYVMVDTYGGADSVVPVAKVGASDYYFAVNKFRPDLLGELETALSKIQDENRFYDQTLFEKYFKTSGANVFLNEEERRWLEGHGPIRVGYQDNDLAYCARDPESGDLTGALKDYLDIASDCLANAHLDFKTVAYPTADAAMEALKKGEIDCVFPSNLSIHDAEQMEVELTPAAMSAAIYTVVRKNEKDTFSQKHAVMMASIEGDMNYDTVIKDHFPDWKVSYYPDTEACIRAVSERKADCFLISNYRYNNLRQLIKKYHLAAIPANVNIDYGFAVAGHEVELYSILASVTGLVPATTINASLSQYYAEEAEVTLEGFIRDNRGFVIAFTLLPAALILIIILQHLRHQAQSRKAEDGMSKKEKEKAGNNQKREKGEQGEQ